MEDLAQWVAVIVALINAFIAFIDKKVSQLFQSSGAITPEAPLDIGKINFLYRWRVIRRNNNGFINKDESNLYYFDKAIYVEKQKARKKRTLILVALAIIIVGGIYFLTN